VHTCVTVLKKLDVIYVLVCRHLLVCCRKHPAKLRHYLQYSVCPFRGEQHDCVTLKHCTGSLERRFEHQLVGSVQQSIDAARRIVTMASYVILVAMATSFSLRVAAMLVSRRLASSVIPQSRPAVLDADPDDQSVCPSNDVVDDVSDDDDVSCHCDVIERHDDNALSPRSFSARQTGILQSLKFYETNV